MTEPVLTARDLCVDRGGRRVLEQVTFSIYQGDVFALLGGNGAGKSTALLTFLGFIPPAGGEAFVHGLNVQQDIQAIRAQTAYLPESVSLYPHLSARENLQYFLSLTGLECSSSEVERVLDEVRLAVDARSRHLSTYSKGMRQKVAIALAVLRRAPLLLLDEPTSGLDPVAIDEFHAILKSMSESGTTVFMVTHDVYGACHVAKRVGLLQQGRMVGMFETADDQQISADEVHQTFSKYHAS